MKIILLSIFIIAIVFIGLGISIFFRKNGKFPETEIGHNKNMKKLGITCVKCDETRRIKKRYLIQIPKIKPSDLRLDLNN
jgi:hypothetical protein